MDISAGGIGLILNEGFRVGTRLALKLMNPAFSRPLEVQVIHVSEVAPGYYLLGGALNTQLQPEELQALRKIQDDTEEDFEEPPPIPRPVVNESKVGRNDPCPCGSGKKYKKCCLSG